jgi:hypothetical protein
MIRLLLVTLSLAGAAVCAACRNGSEFGNTRLAVDQIVPSQIGNSREAFLLIVGSGFRDGATVVMGGNPLAQVTYVNEALLTAVVSPGLAGGGYPVSVTLPDGRTVRSGEPVTVVSDAPTPSTPAATPTPRPSPTATPAPAPTPTRTPTPPPPEPTPQPTPAPTRPPAATPRPSPAPTATARPSPTPTPQFFPPPVQTPVAPPGTPTGTPGTRTPAPD